MAIDAASVAVPGPTDPPNMTPSDSPAQGLIASMLAPVDPARPAFDLSPTGPAEGAATAPEGASSAAFHGDSEGTQQGATATGSGTPQKGIWRAWLLAGATRWAKGGGMQNKRLDLSKAKAQARQLKETRQVTVNKSDGLPSKSSSASGPGNKGLDGKKAPNGRGKDSKNSNGSAHQGPPGRSGRGAGTGPDGKSRDGKSGNSPKTPAGNNRDGKSPKLSKTDDPKRGHGAGGKNGAAGPAGGSGKNTAGGGTQRSGKDSKGHGGTDGRSPKGGDKSDGPSGKAPGAKGDTKGGPGSAGAAGTSGKPGATGAGSKGATDPAGKGSKVDLTKGPEKTPGQSGTAAAGQQPQQTGKPLSTKDSREAGYRDGTRAGRVVAHVQAYGDGFKDGRTDTEEAAAREKARLDEARDARKKARETSDEEQPVTTTATSADYHKPAEPIEVTGVTASHVLLGDGAGTDSMSRGEVRSLKSFERRLTIKAESMAKIAEGTKGLKAHAEGQAKRATQLREDAKGREGGEKLVAALTKLEEAAKVQAAKAEEIHKRAVRAAEGCRVVLTNAETRYGGIYKAVVDSDETVPAELAFYKG